MTRIRGRSRWLIVVATLALVVAGCAPGGLDRSFGHSGRVTTDFFRSYAEAHGVARQRDGKLVAVGFTNAPVGRDFALARYDRFGRLDPTFGTGGRVTTDISVFDDANAVALQPDGKIVVAGSAFEGSDPGYQVFALARYDTDGTLDTSFGTGGIVLGNFASGHDGVNALALQADGKIVVAGGIVLDESTSRTAFAVARYDQDGAVDTGFGTGGLVVTSFGGHVDIANAVTVEPSGRIVAAGIATLQGFGLAAYTTAGAPDLGFGTAGKVTTSLAGRSDVDAYGIALGRDGSLVVTGGSHNPSTGLVDVTVARYGASGTPDSEFGNGGTVTTSFGVEAEGRAVVVDARGDIVVAASNPFAFDTDDFELARYRPDGTLDGRFGHDGLVTTDFFGGSDHARALLVQPDGSIVVAGGATYDEATGGSDLALARYFGRDWPRLP